MSRIVDSIGVPPERPYLFILSSSSFELFIGGPMVNEIVTTNKKIQKNEALKQKSKGLSSGTPIYDRLKNNFLPSAAT